MYARYLKFCTTHLKEEPKNLQTRKDKDTQNPNHLQSMQIAKQHHSQKQPAIEEKLLKCKKTTQKA
jgi:hypothetical protein